MLSSDRNNESAQNSIFWDKPNTMKFRLLVFCMLVLHYACAQHSSFSITELSKEEVHKLVLLDVRTPKEFESGHIEGALNINLFDEDFNTQVQHLNKETPVYVYCKLGGRSLKAQHRLMELGFSKVINLEGGYDAWSAANK